MLIFALSDTDNVFGIDEALAFRRSGLKVPPVLCPACRKQLIAKLGEKVAHHFAHQPNADPCFGSTGEGELHISAKLQLLRSIQSMAAKGHELYIVRPCRGCEANISTLALQLQPGDRAEVEVWLDPTKTLKPDLTVWRGKERIALFEVLATHPCGPEKLAALQRFGVPMVEVEARSIVGEGEQPPWVAPGPLPFKTAVGLQVQAKCNHCLAEEEKQRERRAHEQAMLDAVYREEEEREEQLRLSPHVRVLAHCWVHMYLRSGNRRDLLFLLARICHTGART
ncbi:MAG TPA: competence protein CoiA family protein [Archangium sp.]|nr:competence protein CoiA family protein [Archangium sp.]